MLSFLQQPYPVRDLRFVKALYQALLSGVLISFILLVFQPFGTYNWHHPYKTVILSGYGVVAVVANLLDFAATHKFSKTIFAEQSWTIWKEITRNMAGFIVAGFLCVVYGYWAGLMPFSLSQITYMVVICFLIGIIPATVLVLLNYTYLLHKYNQPVIPHHVSTGIVEEDNKVLELVAENGKDHVIIPANELLYISASDNYCTIVFHEHEKLQKVLLRSSLSRLESQLNVSGIIRCHRSFIVNLSQVRKITGNAQGYKLHFDILDEPIPVSRSYSSILSQIS